MPFEIPANSGVNIQPESSHIRQGKEGVGQVGPAQEMSKQQKPKETSSKPRSQPNAGNQPSKPSKAGKDSTRERNFELRAKLKGKLDNPQKGNGV